MNLIKSKLPEFNLNNKKVFVRADLNVPLKNGEIEQDFRLVSIKPTLNYIIEKKAKIVLATHIDRPKDYDPKLSTKNLINWFEEHNFNIIFAPNLYEASKLINTISPGEIVLLENLRFFEGETSPIKTVTNKLAKELANLVDYYINDAFGVSHENDTSVTLLPQLFDINHKTIGFLVEKELEVLSKLKENPNEPFLIVLGGAKIKDKLPVIKNLLDKANNILLCPAIVFTFLKALNKPVGDSLVDISVIQNALETLEADKSCSKIIFPEDYLIGKTGNYIETFYTQNTNIPDFYTGIAVGPKTLDNYENIIKKSKTIFLNGPMGFEEYPETQKEFKALLQAVAESNAFSVIGGGESVAAVYKYGLQSAINFCSTGGGATLHYLAGFSLPGIISVVK